MMIDGLNIFTACDPESEWNCVLVEKDGLCGYEFYKKSEGVRAKDVKLFCRFDDLKQALILDGFHPMNAERPIFITMELLRRYVNKGTEYEQSIPFESKRIEPELPVETGIERYFRELEQK